MVKWEGLMRWVILCRTLHRAEETSCDMQFVGGFILCISFCSVLSWRNRGVDVRDEAVFRNLRIKHKGNHILFICIY